MCGIAGVIDFGGHPDPALGIAMADVLRHRGPDEAGHHADDDAVLAVRRLSIQDVAHGHQPAFSEDGAVSVVLNGEIYNFRELAELVRQKGHRLASGSDTEVLPHLYEEFGAAFLTHLRGMFAVAVWDARARQLIVARDRLGKKPLYYTQRSGSFRFASEIKAFFADRGVPREPDLAAIHEYLVLQYVPAPRTAFTGIHALPPASLLRVDEHGQHLERWWHLDRPPTAVVGPGDAKDIVRDALRESVSLRMIADVPLGAFLSGGVDSACVVATMAELSTRVRTFTVGFQERERDERALARETAAALGTDHTELVVEPDAAGLLPVLAWHHDQPFADHSTLPTYLLARETKQHVTVALNGDGGDEAFVGYPRIQRMARRAVPGVSALAALARRPAAGLAPGHPVALGSRALLRAVGSPSSRYVADAEIFPEPFLRNVYTDEMRMATKDVSAADHLLAALASNDGGDPVWRGQMADYATYLPGALLPKADVATMAASLEARSPFLDHEFIAAVSALPTSAKYGLAGPKLALRNAFRGRVPDAVLDGDKRGFGLPLETWFRGKLAPMARALLTRSSSTAQLVRPEMIDRLLDEHDRGRGRHGTRIYALVALELWYRTFITSPPPLAPPVDTILSDLA